MSLTFEQEKLLEIIGSALFNKEQPKLNIEEVIAVFEEAQAQAVALLMYYALPAAFHNQNANVRKSANLLIAANMRIQYEHMELHEMLSDAGIPYVSIKGVASAKYYPVSLYRTLGDVDFLAYEKDFARIDKLLKEADFTPEQDTGDKHIEYHRDGSLWEMHRSVNGIPDGSLGDAIREYMKDCISSAELYHFDGGEVYIPDTFHHGLILLLHTASHMTSAGIGVRHLCDWAVFAASMDDDEFAAVFEVPLKECGLWRFAQLLTLCCVKYLKMPERAWAGSAKDELLERMICDIMSGGNFGKKDQDRYKQIKYIKNWRERTVDTKSTIVQVWDTIGIKAKKDNKSRLSVIGDYFALVVGKKRKMDSFSTLDNAARRKKLYSEFKLFEVETE